MSQWLTIVVAVIGSGAVFGFIQFMITRHDKKKENKTEERFNQFDELIKKVFEKLRKNEVDNVRLQLLFLIKFFPDQTHEIMKCAQHYFDDLHGNWYATTMFNRFLEETKIAKPEWFSGESEE